MPAKTNTDIYKELQVIRKEIRDREEHLEDKIDQTYLRIAVFEAKIKPLEKFVYGVAGLVGGALITAVIGLVVSTQ